MCIKQGVTNESYHWKITEYPNKHLNIKYYAKENKLPCECS